MKGILLTILVFLTWFAIAGSYYTCAIKGLCDSEETFKSPSSKDSDQTTSTIKSNIIKKTDNASAEINSDNNSDLNNKIDSLISGGLQIYDGKQLVKSYYGNFKIYENNTKIQTPYGLSNYGFDLAAHMDETNSRLTVIGYFNLNEKDTIGIKRAEFIKDRLVKLGIPEKIITTESKKAIFNFENRRFRGGIQFEFEKLDSVITLNAVNFDQEVPLKNPASIKSELSVEEFLDNYTKPIVEKTKDTTNKVIDKKPVKKLPKAKFIIFQESFKRGKFKASRDFKNFIETHKNAKKITLIGFSNLDDDSVENRQKGFDLANAVEDYISRKKLTNASIRISSKRNIKSGTSKKESVTLLIE